MEGHGISWWEPLFEGMCYMHGMCFDMLTPMLYISVCRRIYGVISGKGSAPLLLWRMQCSILVCAALAAGSGGSGRYLALCLSRFPLPAPRVPRCVWRAVPSGCPLPSLAGTPFHTVCAFRELGPVALPVVPACPLRPCALALPRRPLPPPLGCVACAPRAGRALGAGRALPRVPCPSACPAPVPCSIWLAWGGAFRSWFPPTWLGAVRPPRGGSVALVCRGASFYLGGGGACDVPAVCAAGGASRAGGRSASFRPSAFPGQATKRVSLASFWSWGAWSPYHSGSCSPAFSGRNLCGVLARWRALACSPQFLWEPAAGAGGQVLRLLSLADGGGTIPSASGVGGRRPGGLRACGKGGGGGGSRRGLPAPPMGAARGSLPWPPSCRRRTPPRRVRSVGVAGPPWRGEGFGAARGPPPWGPLQT